MKRTQVVRETAQSIQAAEAALDATIVEAQQALERMIAAKMELGLTGTVGDAAIARVREGCEALRAARQLIGEGHDEATVVLKAMNIRGTAELWRWKTSGSIQEDVRAA